jgi:vesicle transport through interaction with t-SNAREs protein 1
MEADGYVDKSLRTLKGMARRCVLSVDTLIMYRMQTNKLITGGIITVLVVIIVLVLWAKIR